MPSYEYRCRQCRRSFVKVMTFGEHERKSKPACPKCRSRKVEQLPSSFQAVTGKKT
jgi:putative FmdB family regulatory protein